MMISIMYHFANKEQRNGHVLCFVTTEAEVFELNELLQVAMSVLYYVTYLLWWRHSLA